ncbi:DUF732 domain-containing protein [Frankia sp. CNm7]|uniref:DUF732 domain-containing protein n=2 Tax=Frankia nepalensis TaxID=1836974 RepID=A0A937URS3_9ACTN|nr:DUF732 domain-containing protein [Frankia nepalensis]MBL7502120.1 DUF732 domain-containing protein [Frankia nepalensis]MBL7512901.1 DUF732 domain-containing protein [Frankia nepalensis]MBL7523340.1 DUF732 domain-containing protein [Frankia nepalensis]MBL7628096.1 DUF732 domain-containing protein [Frankia nepalensis]
MRPWTLAARAAVGVLAGALALALTGCGPSLADDLPPVAAASPTAGSTTGGPSQPPASSASPTLPPGDKAYLLQIAETLPDLDADDEWKIQQATWTCVELDAGMTLRGAATTSALVSEGKLSVGDAVTLARAAVPNYCPEHAAQLATDGNAPLDRTLDASGQGACFWLDYARELSGGGQAVGDIDLAYAVFAASEMAKRAFPADFRTAWLAMTSDISSPEGLAERRALCEQHGWGGPGQPA